MADEDRPEPASDEPSLELPSLKSALGLGRKRARRTAPPPEASEPGDAPDATPVATTVPVEPEQPAAPQEPGEPLEPVEPVEPGIPGPAGEPVPAPEPLQSPAPSAPDVPAGPPPPEVPGPETTLGPIGLPETQPEVHPTAVLPAATPVEPGPSAEPARRPRRPRPRIHLQLPGPLVALLTGAVVGLALVGLTDAGLHLCTSMRGTSSCGRPGFLVLLVITVAMVFLGSLLLRLAGVETHGSTSLLGVGLLVVVILLALLPVIFRWWMVFVVPVVAMLTYAAAWWVTTTNVEPGERVR